MAHMQYNEERNEFDVFTDDGEWYAQGNFEEMQDTMWRLSYGEENDYDGYDEY